jgi:hypothetical protein
MEEWQMASLETWAEVVTGRRPDGRRAGAAIYRSGPMEGVWLASAGLTVR